MTADRRRCDPEAVMGYLDNESRGPEQGDIGTHLADCPRCRRLFGESRSVSRLFNEHLERAVAAAPLEGLDDVVVARVKARAGGRRGTRRRTGAKKWLIPAGAFAAAAMVLLFSVFDIFREAREPSAIINSFTAETSSVMILETPETRQTILWFRETPKRGGEDDGMQQI